jgi:glycosyltransferase involved in cell wall biosynthesis
MFSVKGGDTVQAVKTADELKKIGVTTEVFRACDTIPYDKFDLLHFFNIIRPADHLYHIRKSKKPYVISTIYLQYDSFDRHGRGKLHRTLFGLLGESRSEHLKNLYRFIKKQDRFISKEYLLGHKRAMKKILKGASIILPNSHSEYTRIVRDMNYKGEYHVVPNGVDGNIFTEIPKNIVREDKIICVAQIFGMKNQHALIVASEKLNVPLEIIGNPPPNHTGYYDYCKKMSGKNVKFYSFLPQEELVEHYAGAKVHALPSWFETTGLSTLEAGAMDCNLVVGSGGDTKDYFKDFAWFCEPDDQESIEKALSQALAAPNTNTMRKTVLEKYTWKRAAEATYEAYQKVLSGASVLKKEID